MFPFLQCLSPVTMLTTHTSLLRLDQIGSKGTTIRNGQLMCWSKGQEARNQPIPETQRSVLYTGGSLKMSLAFYFLENRGEKQTLPNTGWALAAALSPGPGVRSGGQEEKRAPAALEQQAWPPVGLAPVSTQRCTRASGTLGRRRGRRSSIMHGRRAGKSWRRGKDGEAEAGEKLSSESTHTGSVHPQNSVSTNGGRGRKK